MNLTRKSDRIIISAAVSTSFFVFFIVVFGSNQKSEVRPVGEVFSASMVKRLKSRSLKWDSFSSGKIYSGDTVVTADEKAVLRFPDGKQATIWPNSSVQWRLDERKQIDATVLEGAMENVNGDVVRHDDLQASPIPSAERLASPGLFLLPPSSEK